MGCIFHLFCKDIREVQNAWNVLQGDVVESDGVTDAVLANVDVAKFLGDGLGVTPGNAATVVVVHDRSGIGHIGDVEIPEKKPEEEKHFDALVHSFDFRFARAATGAFLTGGGPFDGTTHVESNGAEKRFELFGAAEFARFGRRGILGTPIGISMGGQITEFRWRGRFYGP